MIKRKLTDGNAEERYARRNEKGQFAGSVDDGGLLSSDCSHKAKDEAKAGECDRATAAPSSDWP
ncbi:hypothetical protein [Rhizobium mongolense]|uniref:Uncharacterized protein n=2 Tax=Rhizobium mongolense TaxID=57676 RepID=A0ABR6IEN0_9HYPH|nr:hypothetical protein [Rhizobium mongolense]MBB4226329.1 hypothetical protein [Rhizobium mongolense]TVZ73611.1 hypothetical protein BCL32_1857 [Rhizobium mongolense USDA 1844]